MKRARPKNKRAEIKKRKIAEIQELFQIKRRRKKSKKAKIVKPG